MKAFGESFKMAITSKSSSAEPSESIRSLTKTGESHPSGHPSVVPAIASVGAEEAGGCAETRIEKVSDWPLGRVRFRQINAGAAEF
jgi:hypothetical protein